MVILVYIILCLCLYVYVWKQAKTQHDIHKNNHVMCENKQRHSMIYTRITMFLCEPTIVCVYIDHTSHMFVNHISPDLDLIYSCVPISSFMGYAKSCVYHAVAGFHTYTWLFLCISCCVFACFHTYTNLFQSFPHKTLVQWWRPSWIYDQHKTKIV
jgi:hypothetical protein